MNIALETADGKYLFFTRKDDSSASRYSLKSNLKLIQLNGSAKSK